MSGAGGSRPSDEAAVVDKHGDVWRFGADGLMHTRETAPFPREYVERKWGPLRPVADLGRPAAPSCCPGAGSMAHVRGCRNHPEADRG